MEFLDLVKELGEKERRKLVKDIMVLLNSDNGDRGCHALVEAHHNTRPNCPHCSAQAEMGYIVKRGVNRNGAQTFYCKKCNRYFVSTTNTAFERTRKSADVWSKFIEMTITGYSLNTCAEECGIAYQTAFTWRHKILSAFAKNQEAVQMSGTVEVDEMLVHISYKGNHVQGSFGKRVIKPDVLNDMPREAYRRGSDNKSKSSKDKVCVFCMVQDGNKAFYAAVPGIGFMSDAMLNYTVAKHIDKENTLMLADSYKTTKNISRKTDTTT